jgi:hypothetical protein
MTITANPVSELVRFLAASVGLARTARRFEEVMTVEVAQDITAEAVTHVQAVGAAAHKAEVYDREAVKLMDEVLADGVVTPDEVKQLRKAREFAKRSAEVDHDITEATALS